MGLAGLPIVSGLMPKNKDLVELTGFGRAPVKHEGRGVSYDLAHAARRTQEKVAASVFNNAFGA